MRVPAQTILLIILPLIHSSVFAYSIYMDKTQPIYAAQNQYLIPVSNSNKHNAPKIKKISRENLEQFILQFSILYEEGDLKNFMSLFAANAETNDASNKTAIQNDYANLFAATEMRVIDLQGLKWKISGDTAEAKGDFLVTVLHKGGKNMKNFSGKIILELQLNNGKLELSKFFHAYGDED